MDSLSSLENSRKAYEVLREYQLDLEVPSKRFGMRESRDL